MCIRDRFGGPIFPVLVHSLLQNILDLSIENLNLPTGLRMIRCGQLVSYCILSHKSFKGSIAKVSAIIADDSTRGSEVLKNVLFQKLYDNFVIISSIRNGFHPSPQQPICIGFQMD